MLSPLGYMLFALGYMLSPWATCFRPGLQAFALSYILLPARGDAFPRNEQSPHYSTMPSSMQIARSKKLTMKRFLARKLAHYIDSAIAHEVTMIRTIRPLVIALLAFLTFSNGTIG